MLLVQSVTLRRKEVMTVMAGYARKFPPSLHRVLYLPAYTTVEAARLAQTKPATVASWCRGDVFAVRKERRVPLSYLQLAEIAFVASFRKLGVSLQRIRRARDYLSKMFQVEYPFASLRLKTDGVHVLKDLEEAEGVRPTLIVADKGGQEAWPDLIAERLAQFEYEYDIAIRWFPRGKAVPIAVDPRIAFGAPIVLSAGVATWVLKERYEAGESISELVEDFGISLGDLQAALEFEDIHMKAA